MTMVNKNTRYEVRAENGQVLEHGFKEFKQAVNCVWKYKINGHEDEHFTITEYQNGKYGNE